jgi:hypothetical protein
VEAGSAGGQSKYLVRNALHPTGWTGEAYSCLICGSSSSEFNAQLQTEFTKNIDQLLAEGPDVATAIPQTQSGAE